MQKTTCRVSAWPTLWLGVSTSLCMMLLQPLDDGAAVPWLGHTTSSVTKSTVISSLVASTVGVVDGSLYALSCLVY